MTGVLAGAIGGLVSAAAESVKRVFSRGPSFAEVLSATEAVSGSSVTPAAQGEARRTLMSKLLGLPITSKEAREIARRLDSLVVRLKLTAPGNAFPQGLEQACKMFADGVSEEHMLSPDDAAKLEAMVEEYALKVNHNGLPA